MICMHVHVVASSVSYIFDAYIFRLIDVKLFIHFLFLIGGIASTN